MKLKKETPELVLPLPLHDRDTDLDGGIHGLFDTVKTVKTDMPVVAKKRGAAKRSELGSIGRLEDFIPYKLSVVANRVSQSVGKLFETQFNIQIPEWRILMVLYAYRTLVFNEVVARTSMDKARVSRAQRRLVDLGLISSVTDPEDGRRVLLSITKAGTKMCGDIVPHAASTEAWFLDALTADEKLQLDSILDKLMARSLEQ
jgi:DNA-binding MarR family transcriptional regulator